MRGICGQGTCTNTEGSYTCNCHIGYTTAGQTTRLTCVDEDECSSAPCHASAAQCSNTEGSYNCLCQPGYSLSGDVSSACTGQTKHVFGFLL